MLKDTIDNSHLHFIRLLNKFYVFLLRVTPAHVYFELQLTEIYWICGQAQFDCQLYLSFSPALPGVK